MTADEERSAKSPSAEELYAIADAVMRQLPAPFSDSLDGVYLAVEEQMDPETARRRGSNPRNVLGLYRGVPLTKQRVSRYFRQNPSNSEFIFLYRQPILAYWRETSCSLEEIVGHVVIHELGHHFGFSDDEMTAIEDSEG